MSGLPAFCEIVSPLHGSLLSSACSPAIRAKPTGPAEKLLSASAASCFHDLPEGALSKLMAYIGLVPEPPADLYSKLMALINFSRPGIQEDELRSIMEPRVHDKQMVSFGLLHTYGIYNILDEESKNEVGEFNDDFETTVANAIPYTEY